MDRYFLNSTVSWGAIAAGSVIACAVSLLLAALGVGGGLALVSPWYGDSASATTIGWAAGLGLVCMAIIASALGGYITGRLRHPWVEIHEDERYFRDSAHGLATWAFATVLTAGVLTGAGTHLLAGASAGSIPAAGAGAAQGASSQGSTQSGPNDIYVDRMLRSTSRGNQPNDQAATRAELTRILAPIGRRGGQVSQDDRTYAAQVVAARTGLSQEEAQKRVDQTINQAKEAADKARKAAMAAALWSAIALLAGALAGAFAAIEGGKLRLYWQERTPVATTTRTI